MSLTHFAQASYASEAQVQDWSKTVRKLGRLGA